jgi:hypothetical protein
VIGPRRSRRGHGLVTVAAVLGLMALPAGAAGQTLLSDTFTGATTSSPVVAEPNPATPNSAGFPCLTAGANTSSAPVSGCGGDPPDPAGSGVLRLTDGNPSEAASLVFNGTFPTSAGLSVTFDQYQYGGNGADGISFDLAVAPPLPTAGGGGGGALGYTGFPFGYLGVGLDAFGNFTNTLTDGTGCTDPPGTFSGASPNEVAVRGPGNALAGYCLLASSTQLTPDPMSQDGIDLRGDTRASSKLPVNVQIDPGTDTFTVGIDPTGGTNFITVATGPLPASYIDPATGTSVDGLPPRLTFAFSGATGEVDDIHEISNVNVATLTSPVPVLTLAKTDSSGGSVTSGGSLTYQLTAGVSTASPLGETEPATMVVTDPLPAGETLAGTPAGTGWDCSASTATQVSCTNTSTDVVAPGSTLPPVSVPVTVGSAAAPAVSNTATLVSGDAAGQVSATDTVLVSTPPPPPPTGGVTSTTTAVGCSPATVLIGAVSTCTATVTDAAPATSTPAGTVHFTSAKGSFGNGGACSLSAVSGNPGSAACQSGYTPTGSGTAAVGANYDGDPGHLASGATTNVASAPVAGQTATVEVTAGVVLIQIPGHSGFVPLSGGALSVPVGSTVDTLHGAVTLETAGDTLGAANHKHHVDTGTFSEGLFTVKQGLDTHKGASPSTDLVLKTPPGAAVHAKCRRTGPPGKGVVRSLKGVVKGVYRTVGAASTTTTTNGTFLVQDRCDGTLTRVLKGRATVSYKQKRGKRTRSLTRTVKAGQSYLVKERFLADILASR